MATPYVTSTAREVMLNNSRIRLARAFDIGGASVSTK